MGGEIEIAFAVPLAVAELLREFAQPWCVCGGWAIDLFLGRPTRQHADLDLLILRRDQLALQNYFAGEQLRKAVNGKLLPWKNGELLELPVHAIHGAADFGRSSNLEFLLNEIDDAGNWAYRRDDSVKTPLKNLICTSPIGVPYLRPEICLLYKSKDFKEKDSADFESVIDEIGDEQKRWLHDVLIKTDAEHPWIERVENSNK